MRFGCFCGHTISDTTDHLPYAAYAIADKDLESFYAAFEAETLSGDRGILKTDSFDFMKKFYQCPECHRIYFDSEDNLRFVSFVPEGENNTTVTDSIFGEKWKYSLSAHWNERSQWIKEANGTIIYGGLIDGHWDEYNCFEMMEKEYLRLFKELREKDLINCAFFWNGNEKLHEWHEAPKFTLAIDEKREPFVSTHGTFEYPDKRIGSPSIVETVRRIASNYHISEEEAARRFFGGDVLELWQQTHSQTDQS